jgi:phage-related protein
MVEVIKDHRHVSRRLHAAISGGRDVLHNFQNKSKTGRETPRRDMELIRQRLREAEQIAKGGQR